MWPGGFHGRSRSYRASFLPAAVLPAHARSISAMPYYFAGWAWCSSDYMLVAARVELRRMLFMTAGSVVVSAEVAGYVIVKLREKLAALALAASMIPAGLTMVLGVAKAAPCFSLADVARYLDP